MTTAVAEHAAPWFVAVTAGRAERIARTQYLWLGIDAFLPLREMPPTPSRPLVVEPIWPGYIFTREPVIPTAERLFFAAAPERLPRSTLAPAVRSIVAVNGSPIIVPQRFIGPWLDRADPDGLVEHYEPPEPTQYGRGALVRVLSGPWAGAIVSVEEVKGRAPNQVLKLLASCFNTQTVVWMRSEQVAPAELPA